MKLSRRSVFTSLLAACCLRGQSNASDQEWAAFIAWTKALPPGAAPNARDEPFATYAKKLIADGLPEKDADDLVSRIRKRSVENPEWIRVNMDRVYSQEGFHRDKPSVFLVEAVSQLHPGKSLDLGMGEGRNVIYMAQQGWDATGLDVSDVAVAHANEKASALGLRIDARVQSAFTFDFGQNQWDLISLLYFYIYTHPSMYEKIAGGLKPGGRVVVEDVGQPVMEKLMQSKASYEAVKLHLVRLEYVEGINEWTTRPGAIGRLLLQKPS